MFGKEVKQPDFFFTNLISKLFVIKTDPHALFDWALKNTWAPVVLPDVPNSR